MPFYLKRHFTIVDFIDRPKKREKKRSSQSLTLISFFLLRNIWRLTTHYTLLIYIKTIPFLMFFWFSRVQNLYFAVRNYEKIFLFLRNSLRVRVSLKLKVVRVLLFPSFVDLKLGVNHWIVRYSLETSVCRGTWR